MYSQEEKDKKVKHSARAEIYALVDPRTNEIRYIGKSNDSKKRLISHLRDSKTRNYPVYQWINELISIGMIPTLKILIVSDNWPADEKRLIKEYRLAGCDLLNLTKGGDQPYCGADVRSRNGSKVARLVHDNTNKKRIWYLKKELASSLIFFKKNGHKDIYNRLVKRIKENAHNPVFAEFLRFDYET